ncbi:MAG: HvfX family Cu-binding RiPP maturation protein, partial [Gammaproteobacteria bacterium]
MMNTMVKYLNCAQDLLNKTRTVDFLGPLAMRLYLVPIFWTAGANKIDFGTFLPNDGVVQWFGSLGVPFPALNAFLAGWTEVLGAVFLLFGFAVRWIYIPLMGTMMVAIITVHWQNGWLAIA